MFKTWKEKEQLKNENKSKALQITVLSKENEQLKYKQHKVKMEIEKFDFVNGNVFTLINTIKSIVE